MKSHFVVSSIKLLRVLNVCFQINTYDDPGKIYKVRVGFVDDCDQTLLLNKVMNFCI